MYHRAMYRKAPSTLWKNNFQKYEVLLEKFNLIVRLRKVQLVEFLNASIIVIPYTRRHEARVTRSRRVHDPCGA